MLTDLVLSREMSEELVKAGIVIETEYVWVKYVNAEGCNIGDKVMINWKLERYIPEIHDHCTSLPAPILEELLERLKGTVSIVHLYLLRDGQWNCFTETGSLGAIDESDPDPKSAAAKLLIKLSKEGK